MDMAGGLGEENMSGSDSSSIAGPHLPDAYALRARVETASPSSSSCSPPSLSSDTASTPPLLPLEPAPTPTDADGITKDDLVGLNALLANVGVKRRRDEIESDDEVPDAESIASGPYIEIGESSNAAAIRIADHDENAVREPGPRTGLRRGVRSTSPAHGLLSRNDRLASARRRDLQRARERSASPYPLPSHQRTRRNAVSATSLAGLLQVSGRAFNAIDPVLLSRMSDAQISLQMFGCAVPEPWDEDCERRRARWVARHGEYAVVLSRVRAAFPEEEWGGYRERTPVDGVEGEEIDTGGRGEGEDVGMDMEGDERWMVGLGTGGR